MTTIVLVDTDTNALHELAHAIQSTHSKWLVHCVASAEKALELISSVSVDAVISETALGKMTGMDLFTAVKNTDEKIIRIIHSADTDSEVVLESSRAVHRFVAKPVSIDHLVSLLENSFQLRDMLSDRELRNFMLNVNSVPALPAIYNEMMQELASPHSSLIKLANIVEGDTGLSISVIKTVNSAFYGLSQRIESVAQAVTLLGVHLIKNITLTTKVFSCFEGSSLGIKRLTQLNNDAMRIGAIANQFARYAKLPKTTAGHCQLVGMLSNIGELIVTDKNEGNESTSLSSSIVGAYLLHLWKMPDTVVEAVAMQHELADSVIETVTPLTVLHSIRYLQEHYTDMNDDDQLQACKTYLASFITEQLVDTWVEAYQTIEQLTAADSQKAA